MSQVSVLEQVSATEQVSYLNDCFQSDFLQILGIDEITAHKLFRKILTRMEEKQMDTTIVQQHMKTYKETIKTMAIKIEKFMKDDDENLSKIKNDLLENIKEVGLIDYVMPCS